MNILGKLFTRTKTVDDFLDSQTGHLAKIGAWVGNQQFTEEERAKMMNSVTTAVRQFAIDTAKESTARSVTRRSLAILWIRCQLVLVGATFIAGGLDHPHFDNLWAICTSDVMFYGTAGVMIYFFGSYGFGTYVSKKK